MKNSIKEVWRRHPYIIVAVASIVVVIVAILLIGIPEEYTIRYAFNDGIGNTYLSEVTIKPRGENVNLISNKPEREGYDFQGWDPDQQATVARYESGAAYDDDGNITLYAIWARKVFKISYAVNDGTDEEMDEVTDLITDQPARLTDTVPTRDRYRFRGWHVDVAASEDEDLYLPGGMYSGKEDVVLYAIWEPEEIAVNLWLNYGSGEEQLFTTAMISGNQGFFLPREIPEREGYIFQGWDTDSGATKGQYNIGEYYEENQDLYAAWISNSGSSSNPSPIPSSGPSPTPSPFPYKYILMYDDGAPSNVFGAFAYMGSANGGVDGSIEMDTNDSSQSIQGAASMRFSYQPMADIHWSGVMMLFGEGKYSEDPGERGPDLSMVSKMVFHVKGSGGTVKFFVECDGSQFNQSAKTVELKEDWQKVTLELNSDWRYCSIPFGWTCDQTNPQPAGGKIEFWVDNLRFE